MRLLIFVVIISSAAAGFLALKHGHRGPASPSVRSRISGVQHWAKDALTTVQDLKREIAEQEKNGDVP